MRDGRASATMAISDLCVNSFRLWSGLLEVCIASFRGMPNTMGRGRFPWDGERGLRRRDALRRGTPGEMDSGTGKPESRSEMRDGTSTRAQARAARHQDADLAAVERASVGESSAFEALVRKYQGWVFTLAYRMLGDRAEAEDMAQEIFLKVYRALPQFEGKSTFSTWLYTISTNHCLNHLESRRRRPRLQEMLRPARTEGNPDPGGLETGPCAGRRSGSGAGRSAAPDPGATPPAHARASRHPRAARYPGTCLRGDRRPPGA